MNDEFRHVAGDRAKHVVDLVEIVVDGGHVVECPNSAESIEGAYRDYDDAEANAERRGEAARRPRSPDEQEQRHCRQRYIDPETFPVSKVEQLGSFDRPDPPDETNRCRTCEDDVDAERPTKPHEENRDGGSSGKDGHVDRFVDAPGDVVVERKRGNNQHEQRGRNHSRHQCSERALFDRHRLRRMVDGAQIAGHRPIARWGLQESPGRISSPRPNTGGRSVGIRL